VTPVYKYVGVRLSVSSCLSSHPTVVPGMSPTELMVSSEISFSLVSIDSFLYSLPGCGILG